MDTEKSRALAESLGSFLNPTKLIESFGLLGIWVIIFAETGLLVGFFFPGDSLIFLAGVAASPVAKDFLNVRLSLAALLIVTPIMAVVGAQVGYFLGHRYGRRMFQRPDSRLFKQEYVDRAEEFLKRYGPGKAIVLARFTPIVRTFMNPIAGVLRVPIRTFLIWNIVGAVLWTDGILLLGFFLARQIEKAIPPEKIDTYLVPAIVVIVLISLIPIFVEAMRARRQKRSEAEREGAGVTRR